MEEKQGEFVSRRRERGLAFVSRVYPGRVIGLALGGLAVASVFWTEHASWWLWGVLWAAALAWPHFAYGLAINSADPYRTERACLVVDSALGGVFLALMKFNLLPSAIFVAMLSMDKLAVGGVRFLLPCTAALVGACVAAGLLTGFDVRVETTLREIYGSLPLLIVYPLTVGYTSYLTARQLRFQNKQLQAMNETSGLGQMPTRVAWEKALAEEFHTFKTHGLTSSILLVDIDRLRETNERYGFPAGDEVIRSVAVTVRNTLREHDLMGRYGSAQFAVLLPGLDARRAAQMGDRIRDAVGSSVLESTAQVKGTVSVGVATAKPDDRRYRDWLTRADEALKAAKAKGGDRTEIGALAR